MSIISLRNIKHQDKTTTFGEINIGEMFSYTYKITDENRYLTPKIKVTKTEALDFGLQEREKFDPDDQVTLVRSCELFQYPKL